MTSLGDVIERMREQRGLTRLRLEELSGVSRETQRKLANADHSPRSQTLDMIVDAMAPIAPLSASEIAALAAVTRRAPESFARFNRTDEPAATQPPLRIPADAADHLAALLRMLGEAGTTRALASVRAIASTARVHEARPEPAPDAMDTGRYVRVKRPPRQLAPGVVAEDTEYYDTQRPGGGEAEPGRDSATGA